MLKMIFMSIITLVQSQLPGSQVDLSGHGCIIDGGYTWCEDLQTCVRPWEVQCLSVPVTEPITDPVPNCINQCPPPMPCPMPEMNIDVSRCKLNNNVDDCGCQLSCPSYDCTVQNNPTIPENCATWMDGCNTCQVTDGRAGICTMMYCFRLTTPHCLNYHIDENSLNIGDVCYRFCEDGSQVSINRRSDCPINTICSNPMKNSEISFDSCDTGAWICENSGH